MPEYLAPGVFVEEVSYRAKSIEGVSTTTTGFVGPTRYGPIDLEPDIITSLVEFERIYGGKDKLVYEDDGETDNYMWNAVRAFFEEGGKRLYVARAFTATDHASLFHRLLNTVEINTVQFLWAVVPAVGLLLQCVWASVLVLPRTRRRSMPPVRTSRRF